MELKKLPAKQVRENVATLENLLYLSGKVETKWLDNYADYPIKKLEASVIKTLATYGNEALLTDIIEMEELKYDFEMDTHEIHLMTDLYAQWVDKRAFVSREDNLLNTPGEEVRHWKPLFDHALAQLVAEKGQLMAHRRTFYGWEDYKPGADNGMPPIIALFRLRKDEWDEFAGTNPDNHHTGYVAQVLYKNGEFRDLRYEGDIETIMEELSQM